MLHGMLRHSVHSYHVACLLVCREGGGRDRKRKSEKKEKKEKKKHKKDKHKKEKKAHREDENGGGAGSDSDVPSDPELAELRAKALQSARSL